MEGEKWTRRVFKEKNGYTLPVFDIEILNYRTSRRNLYTKLDPVPLNVDIGIGYFDEFPALRLNSRNYTRNLVSEIGRWISAGPARRCLKDPVFMEDFYEKLLSLTGLDQRQEFQTAEIRIHRGVPKGKLYHISASFNVCPDISKIWDDFRHDVFNHVPEFARYRIDVRIEHREVEAVQYVLEIPWRLSSERDIILLDSDAYTEAAQNDMKEKALGFVNQIVRVCEQDINCLDSAWAEYRNLQALYERNPSRGR